MLFPVICLIFFVFYTYQIQFAGAICLGLYIFFDRKDLSLGFRENKNDFNIFLGMFFSYLLILSALDGKNPDELLNLFAVSCICILDNFKKQRVDFFSSFYFLTFISIEIFVILACVFLEGNFWILFFLATLQSMYINAFYEKNFPSLNYGSKIYLQSKETGSEHFPSHTSQIAGFSKFGIWIVVLNTVVVCIIIFWYSVNSLKTNSLFSILLNPDSSIIDRILIVSIFFIVVGFFGVGAKRKRVTNIFSLSRSQKEKSQKKRLIRFCSVFKNRAMFFLFLWILFFFTPSEFSDPVFTILIVFSFVRIELEKKVAGGAIESQSSQSI